MIDRSKVVVGIFALLATVSAIGFGLMFSRLGDGCMNGSDSGSCPTLADVNGVRYTVGVARGIEIGSDDVAPYSTIARTNVPDYFSELATYAHSGVPATAVIAAPAAAVLDEDDSPYRLLWGPDRSSAFPALCRYFSSREAQLLEECRRTEPT